jgi:hypothetical protein
VNSVAVQIDHNLMNDVDCDRDHLVGIDHRDIHPLQNQRPLYPYGHVCDDDEAMHDETDLMVQAAGHVADIRLVHRTDHSLSVLAVLDHLNDPLELVHNELDDYDHD